MGTENNQDTRDKHRALIKYAEENKAILGDHEIPIRACIAVPREDAIYVLDEDGVPRTTLDVFLDSLSEEVEENESDEDILDRAIEIYNKCRER